MPETRLVLEREDFGRLVRGRDVRRDGVAMMLADIGWSVMLHEIGAAIRGAEPFRAPGERQASATTLLRSWWDALCAARASETVDAGEDLQVATQAIEDWCRQEFGEDW